MAGSPFGGKGENKMDELNRADDEESREGDGEGYSYR